MTLPIAELDQYYAQYNVLANTLDTLATIKPEFLNKPDKSEKPKNPILDFFFAFYMNSENGFTFEQDEQHKSFEGYTLYEFKAYFNPSKDVKKWEVQLDYHCFREGVDYVEILTFDSFENLRRFLFTL